MDYFSEAVAAYDAIDEERAEIRAMVAAILATCQECADIAYQLRELR